MRLDVEPALAAIGPRIGRPPRIAMVLGSGLGALADELDDAQSIATEDIPGYPPSTVAGHAGRLVAGRLEGHDVLVIQGRPHLYEGHSIRSVTFPIRLAHALGARRVLLTNAAGGVNPAFGPGTLMLIEDHLNLSGVGPTGIAVPEDDGAPPAGLVAAARPAFDAEWCARAQEVARSRGIPVSRGVYAWTMGPSYETPAEIRYFRYAGADAVGMSTVPEALQASALGMLVLGISAITNPAAGLSAEPLDHADVLEVGRQVRDRFAGLVRGIVAELPG